MLFIGKAVDTSAHKHHNIQISIGLANPFKLKINDTWEEYYAVIIDKDQLHQFDGGEEWQLFILMEAETLQCRQIRRQLLAHKKIHEFSVNQEKIITLLSRLIHEKNVCVKEVFNEIIRCIIPIENKLSPLEPRVQNVINSIQQLSEKNISGRYLASLVHLSESRLMHIFKEQVGIPIRSYLLWFWMIKAIKLIMSGTSFTDASHQTGFTDSAHFCHVFRQMFGMKLSDVFKNSNYIQLFVFSE
jgi:AraC-like DNA-binding protein